MFEANCSKQMGQRKKKIFHQILLCFVFLCYKGTTHLLYGIANLRRMIDLHCNEIIKLCYKGTTYLLYNGLANLCRMTHLHYDGIIKLCYEGITYL